MSWCVLINPLMLLIQNLKGMSLVTVVMYIQELQSGSAHQLKVKDIQEGDPDFLHPCDARTISFTSTSRKEMIISFTITKNKNHNNHWALSERRQKRLRVSNSWAYIHQRIWAGTWTPHTSHLTKKAQQCFSGKLRVLPARLPELLPTHTYTP